MVHVREAQWKRRSGWWLRDRSYIVFMLREAGGVLSALYGIILLGLLISVHGGEDAFDAYLALIRSPLVLLLSGVILAFTFIHAVTWFFLIGRMQQVSSRSPKPWQFVFAMNLAIFVAASGAVLYFIFGWRPF